MDVRMPKVNGVDALRQIRAARPMTRVILMTAYAAAELLDAAEREGALRILRKPVHMDDLLALLDTAAWASRTVLVVDDNAAYLRTLADALTTENVQVVTASSLDDALARMESHAPGAVLLDLKLDHIDAEKAMVAIRDISPSVLLILYSGHDLELKRALDTAPGGLVDAAFTKPIPLDRLLEVLDGVR
jgi:two-component system, NtrC family, response regulator HydG